MSWTKIDVERLLVLREELEIRIRHGFDKIPCEDVVGMLDDICGHEMDGEKNTMKANGWWDEFVEKNHLDRTNKLFRQLAKRRERNEL